MGWFTRNPKESKAESAKAASAAVAPKATPNTPPAKVLSEAPPGTFELWGKGRLEPVRLNGSNMAKILKQRGSYSDGDPNVLELETMATLVREVDPDDTGDSTVFVNVDELTVGRLSKSDAKAMSPVLEVIGARGLIPQAPVRLKRYTRHQTPLNLLWVTVGPPHEAVPANDPPDNAYILPFSRYGSPISGVNEYQDELRKLLGGHETASLWGVLRPALTPRGKLQVSVTVDGKEIGTLGAAPLGDIGETVREWTEAGLVVVAGVRLAAKDETVRANLLVGKPSKS